MKPLIQFTIIIFIFLSANIAFSQSTAFSYQGKLTDLGTTQASYQMQFKLFDAATGGTQIGDTIENASVAVNQGVFSVLLDFGANVFTGADRFLEIGVRRNASENYTILSPRQQIASSPYSIRTLSAAQADVALDSNKLGGIDASEYVTTTSVANSFIKNGNTQQTANFNISGSGAIGGNFGIGTQNPTSKLDVRGNLTFESGTSPIIYASTAATEQNRFLQLINSINAPSASGLKAGGILISDQFDFANPGKNDLIVKGNIGIGTPAPISRLTIGASGYGFTQTDGNIIVGSYINSSGGWFGTKSNHPLNFFANDSQPLMTVTQQGNVGIGTTTPPVKLSVQGSGTIESSTISTNERSILSLNSTIGGANRVWTMENGLFGTPGLFGIYDRTAGQGRLVINTAGNVGIGTTTPNTTLSVVGNASQDLNSYGLPKAMIYVLANGTVSRCYNGLTGASTPATCGFSVSISQIDGPHYLVNFGFNVSNRFFSVVNVGGNKISANIRYGSGNNIIADFWETDATFYTVASDFYLIVY